MIAITLVLLGATACLSQSIIPIVNPWSIPFTGNPLVKDSTLIHLSTLGTRLIDDKVVLKTGEVKPLKIEDNHFGVKIVKDVLVDKAEDDKCLKIWGFNCLTLARMSPDEMCRKTGMGCINTVPIMSDEELCRKLRVGCDNLCKLKGFGCEFRGLEKTLLPVIIN